MEEEMQSRESKPISTRGAILSRAADLFSEKGYAATSMADLAEQLGLSKAAIYHHFESKEAILLNLVHSIFEEMETLVNEAERGRPRELDKVDILRRFADIAFLHRQVIGLVLFRFPAEVGAQIIEQRDYMARLQRNLAGRNPTIEQQMRARAATFIIATGVISPPVGRALSTHEVDISLLVKIAQDALTP